MRNALLNAQTFITPRRCLVAAAVFFSLMVGLGALPANTQALSTMAYDKVLHFTAYTVLSSLIWGALTCRTAHRAMWTLLITALLAGIDESIQVLLPHRDADWLDWMVDMLAALSCVALFFPLALYYRDKPVAIVVARSRTSSSSGLTPQPPDNF